MYELIKKAVKDLEIAENQFNYCNEEFIESAIHRYNHAQEKLNTLIKMAKGGLLL